MPPHQVDDRGPDPLDHAALPGFDGVGGQKVKPGGTQMAIFITGDTHGDFTRLRPLFFPAQSDMTKQDYVIICGDFGSALDKGSTIF